MDYEIRNRPSYALLDVDLAVGESLTAEAGALVSHTDGMSINTSRGEGGLFKSVKRSVLGGESFFRNTYTAEQPGHVTLAPALPGDVIAHELTGETLYVQAGSYLASGPSIGMDTKFGGAKSFLGGEGFFLLELTGEGPVFMSSYGAVEPVELAAGERYTIDSGHIVAFEGTTRYDVRRVGGLKSTLFSGEGLVVDFEGPGTVWLQTRSEDAFLSWLIPRLPSRSSD